MYVTGYNINNFVTMRLSVRGVRGRLKNAKVCSREYADDRQNAKVCSRESF